MIETILYIVVSVLSVGSILGFATLRSSIRKARAEANKAIADAKTAEFVTKGQEIDNIEKISGIWENLAGDLYKRVDSQALEIECLKRKIEVLEVNFCAVKDCPNRIRE